MESEVKVNSKEIIKRLSKLQVSINDIKEYRGYNSD